MDRDLPRLQDFVRRARSYGLLRTHGNDEDATQWLDEALGPGGVGEDLAKAGITLEDPYDRALVLALDPATGYSFDPRAIQEPSDYVGLLEIFGQMAEGCCTLSDVELRANEDTDAPELACKVNDQAFVYPVPSADFDLADYLIALDAALHRAGVRERYHAVPFVAVRTEGREADKGSCTVLFAAPEAWTRMLTDGFLPAG